MTLSRDHASRLKAVSLDASRLEAQLAKTQTKRDTLIRTAAGNGGSYREIAEVTGLSFQRVAQIVTGATEPTLASVAKAMGHGYESRPPKHKTNPSERNQAPS